MRRFFTQLAVVTAFFGTVGAQLVHADDNDKLIIISPHWEGMRYEMGTAFSKKIKRDSGVDITVSWLDVGGTSEIVRYVASEFKGSPESIGADLVFGGGTDPFERFAKEGFLENLELGDSLRSDFHEDLNGVPLVDAKQRWISPTLSAFGVLCNKRALDRLNLPVPQSWEELAEPSFASWFGLADPRRSGSLHMTFEVVLQAHGWKKGWAILQGMTANLRAMSSDSHRLAQDVVSGEIGCAPAIDSQAATYIREAGSENITFIIPPDRSVVNGDAVGILKGAPHLDLARSFVKFLMSEQAQRILMCDPGTPLGPEKYALERLPVLANLYTDEAPGCSTPKYNPFARASSFRFNPKVSSTRWDAVNELVGAFLIEPMAQLQAIRRTNAPLPVAMPVSEAAVDAAVPSWTDRLTRARDVRDWQALAASMYPGKGSSFRWVPPFLFLVFIAAALVRRIGKAFY